MSGNKLPGPTCSCSQPGPLDSGTSALWWTPPPQPTGMSTRPHATQPANPLWCPAPGPDVSYLFNSCRNPQRGLSDADYEAAAAQLGIEVNLIKAVAQVESPRGAFDDQGRPSILYERHYFRDLTAGRHTREHPDICGNPYVHYGTYSSQYVKLAKAHALEPSFALQSASWGRFQIMGKNYAAAGFQTVEHMVDAMARSEHAQLQAFVNFIQSNAGMHQALKAQRWARFARLYNGPDFQKYDYDHKLEAAYQQLSQPAGQAGPGAAQPNAHGAGLGLP